MIAISHAVRDVLLADGIAPDRICVIHSGIDLPCHPCQLSRPSIRESLVLPRDCRLAVNVAALVGHKDHRTLIETARLLRSRLPDLHWAVAGAGPLRGAIETQIAEAGLNGYVHLLGAIPDGVPLISAADVFVMSSSEEGLGTSVLDAMALGRARGNHRCRRVAGAGGRPGCGRVPKGQAGGPGGRRRTGFDRSD